MTRKIWNFNEGGNWFTFYWGDGIFRVWFGLPSGHNWEFLARSPCRWYGKDGKKDFHGVRY